MPIARHNHGGSLAGGFAFSLDGVGAVGGGGFLEHRGHIDLFGQLLHRLLVAGDLFLQILDFVFVGAGGRGTLDLLPDVIIRHRVVWVKSVVAERVAHRGRVASKCMAS